MSASHIKTNALFRWIRSWSLFFLRGLVLDIARFMPHEGELILISPHAHAIAKTLEPVLPSYWKFQYGQTGAEKIHVKPTTWAFIEESPATSNIQWHDLLNHIPANDFLALEGPRHWIEGLGLQKTFCKIQKERCLLQPFSKTLSLIKNKSLSLQIPLVLIVLPVQFMLNVILMILIQKTRRMRVIYQRI